MNFGIRSDYLERTAPEYALDDDVSGFQPHVYTLAFSMARMIGCRRVIDVGCGAASKLASFYPTCEIIGLDYGANLARARLLYPFGQWLDVDLEHITPEIVDPSQAIIICADVIEHLLDPSALLSTLRFWLQYSSLALLSTPERVLCWGRDHHGPPPNPTHVREWTRVELVNYLTAAGLTVVFSGFTQTHDAHPETGEHQGCQTTLVILEGRSQ